MANKTVRKTQLVTPFGPGAIFDILGESFVVVDTSKWGKGRILKSPRLESFLGENSIVEPPTGKKRFKGDRAKGVEVLRFPRWLFCPLCRNLQLWNYDAQETGDEPHCQYCKRNIKMVPMRFIQVCENGHMSDVDWSYFVHSLRKNSNCKSRNLSFNSLRGKGGGLESLEVTCNDCKLKKNLAEITHKDFLKRSGVKCSGRQPWQHRANAVECQETPQILQRGASNVYFPEISSALDVPPESFFTEEHEAKEKILASPEFKTLTSFAQDSHMFGSMLNVVTGRFDVSESYVLDLIDGKGEKRGNEMEINDAEWLAFNKKYDSFNDRDTFITEHVDLIGDNKNKKSALFNELDRLIDKVVIARKLREVRVLTEYHRYTPDGEGILPSFSKTSMKFPGLEVFGEGIFLTLNEEILTEWESSLPVQKRAEELDDRRENSLFKNWLPKSTPRFILLHTLAHLLIRQMAYESGYSSASLRERIYPKKEKSHTQAGLLIYTASGDSEGTLGGLARKGEAPNLAKTLINSFRSAVWCSNDPICMEMRGQGIDDLNKAACHACSLVSETSCVYNNSLLDRAMLFGDGKGMPGYFEKITNLIFEK